jgi:hypothetical protein
MADCSVRTRLLDLVPAEPWSERERERLATLMELFATLPAPPDPHGLFPDYEHLQRRLVAAIASTDGELLEEAFLELYCHLHGHEAPYSADERRRVNETGGYWCHAGGLSPILKAGEHLEPGSVSGDFGAGNGLQTLLMQKLHPHRLTVQIEISERMVEAGRELQAWLGIPGERVEWVVGDVLDHVPAGMDFVYLYRPVRPEGEGRRFYERFAATLESSPSPVVVFSIADCLREFLSTDFEVFYSDGHLTCIRRR